MKNHSELLRCTANWLDANTDMLPGVVSWSYNNLTGKPELHLAAEYFSQLAYRHRQRTCERIGERGHRHVSMELDGITVTAVFPSPFLSY